MKGAATVEAIDVDEWAYRNALENIERNHCTNIHCHLGDATLLKELWPLAIGHWQQSTNSQQPIANSQQQFDLIIANINRNILLRDMEAYDAVLRRGGTILFSGFYTADIPALVAKAEGLGMALLETREKEGWSAIFLGTKR